MKRGELNDPHRIKLNPLMSIEKLNPKTEIEIPHFVEISKLFASLF